MVYRRRGIFGFLAGCSVVALAQPSFARSMDAQTEDAAESQRLAQTQRPIARIDTGVPEGFESLSNDVSTLFDIYVLGQRIGAFRATLSNGFIQINEPALVARALSGLIEREAVMAMLAGPIKTNEGLRCLPSQTINCGTLPPGQTGAIVDPQRFSLELFFAPSAFLQPDYARPTLGRSSSTGPSLIQNISLAGSISDGSNSRVSYGLSLDTYASVGQSAFIAQTLVRDEGGSEINQALVQHVWSERIARAGLFEDYNNRLLTSYRMLGVEFGSFYPRMAYGTDSATPIQIVLARSADVEIRRNGILLSVRHYEAGPQQIDTSTLPNGSYAISVTAVAEGIVILDETHSFARAGSLPPKGKTEFSIRAGVYADNRFSGGNIGQSDPFLPQLGKDPLVGAYVSRRIAPATAGSLGVLSISGKNYVEASITTAVGNIEGFAAATVGDDGTYGFIVNGATVIQNIRFSLSGRWVEPGDDPQSMNMVDRKYNPFFRSERSIFGSMQFSLLGGSATIVGNYTESNPGRDRYSFDVRYSRPAKIGRFPAIASAFGRVSNDDVRVGLAFSTYFGMGSKTRATASAGVEHVSKTNGSLRTGLSPIASASLSRRETMPGLDVVGRIGASTDATSERAYAGANIMSSYGLADITAQYIHSRGGFSTASLFGNLQTGFAVGGGGAKFGLAQAGEAVILTDLKLESPDEAKSASERSSGYRVQINTQSLDLLKPGRTSATGLSAYDRYTVSLVPENAPPYEVDIRRREVTLYPGNVVKLNYEALRSYTLFGQMVDQQGNVLRGWIIRSAEDLFRVGDDGYFTITSPAGSSLTITSPDGRLCQPVAIDQLVGGKKQAEVHRIGRLVCTPEE